MKRFLHRVGWFQSQLLLSLLYLVIWVPVGILSLCFADWLRRIPRSPSQWWERNSRLNLPEHLKEPF